MSEVSLENTPPLHSLSSGQAFQWVSQQVVLSPEDSLCLQNGRVSGEWLSTVDEMKARKLGMSPIGAMLLSFEIESHLGDSETKGEERNCLQEESETKIHQIESPRNRKAQRKTKIMVGQSFVAQTPNFSTNELELELQPGDDVTVLEQDEFGWIRARSNTSMKFGWFHRSVLCPSGSELKVPQQEPRREKMKETTEKETLERRDQKGETKSLDREEGPDREEEPQPEKEAPRKSRSMKRKISLSNLMNVIEKEREGKEAERQKLRNSTDESEKKKTKKTEEKRGREKIESETKEELTAEEKIRESLTKRKRKRSKSRSRKLNHIAERGMLFSRSGSGINFGSSGEGRHSSLSSGTSSPSRTPISGSAILSSSPSSSPPSSSCAFEGPDGSNQWQAVNSQRLSDSRRIHGNRNVEGVIGERRKSAAASEILSNLPHPRRPFSVRQNDICGWQKTTPTDRPQKVGCPGVPSFSRTSTLQEKSSQSLETTSFSTLSSLSSPPTNLAHSTSPSTLKDSTELQNVCQEEPFSDPLQSLIVHKEKSQSLQELPSQELASSPQGPFQGKVKNSQVPKYSYRSRSSPAILRLDFLFTESGPQRLSDAETNSVLFSRPYSSLGLPHSQLSPSPSSSPLFSFYSPSSSGSSASSTASTPSSPPRYFFPLSPSPRKSPLIYKALSRSVSKTFTGLTSAKSPRRTPRSPSRSSRSSSPSSPRSSLHSSPRSSRRPSLPSRSFSPVPSASPSSSSRCSPHRSPSPPPPSSPPRSPSLLPPCSPACSPTPFFSSPPSPSPSSPLLSGSHSIRLGRPRAFLPSASFTASPNFALSASGPRNLKKSPNLSTPAAPPSLRGFSPGSRDCSAFKQRSAKKGPPQRGEVLLGKGRTMNRTSTFQMDMSEILQTWSRGTTRRHHYLEFREDFRSDRPSVLLFKQGERVLYLMMSPNGWVMVRKLPEKPKGKKEGRASGEMREKTAEDGRDAEGTKKHEGEIAEEGRKMKGEEGETSSERKMEEENLEGWVPIELLVIINQTTGKDLQLLDLRSVSDEFAAKGLVSGEVTGMVSPGRRRKRRQKKDEMNEWISSNSKWKVEAGRLPRPKQHPSFDVPLSPRASLVMLRKISRDGENSISGRRRRVCEESDETEKQKRQSDAKSQLLQKRGTVTRLDVDKILTTEDVDVLLKNRDQASPKKKFSKSPSQLFRAPAPSVKIFGGTIERICEATGEIIPHILSESIHYLTRTALSRQGIFRVNGVFSEVRRLRGLFSIANKKVNLSKISADPHAVATLLKGFLAELGEPCIPSELAPSFVENHKENQDDKDSKNNTYKDLLTRLPTSSRLSLFVLLQFLHKIHQKREANSMDAHNLGIVFGPNLLRLSGGGGGGGDPFAGLSDLSTPASIIAELIESFPQLKKTMERSLK